MKNRLKKFINGNIFLSISLAILGILIAVFPKETNSFFAYAAGIIMLSYGIYLLVSGRKSIFNPFGFSILGVALVILGINALIDPIKIISFLPILLGVWFISTSISKLRMCAGLKAVSTSAYVSALILAFVSMGIGIYFVFRSVDASEVVTMVLGVLLAVYAFADLIDMIIFKKHINKVDEFLSKNIKDVTGKSKIQEAEIVEKKK